MIEFTPFEYLCIDVANGYKLDKLRFEDRIQWTLDNINQLEQLAEGKKWKERPLYIKAVSALRKAQKGLPTGHLVAFDAVCSGLQMLSVLSGCEAGARATGLIDPDRRADAYTDCTRIMESLLGSSLADARDDVKQALMTAFYGSKAEPIKLFGDGTRELEAFYRAMYRLSPGATKLLETLLDSWQPYALVHQWKLPDGFTARVKVMQGVEKRIEVDELNHSTFTYVYYVNEGEESGIKNPANVTHSVDAYVLRSLIRRCSYDRELVQWAFNAFQAELLARSIGHSQQEYHWEFDDKKLSYYMDQYERSGIADIVILPHLSPDTVCALSDKHLKALVTICESMLVHAPFEITTVHDDFRCHPNNMNHLRSHYLNILREIADSNLMQDILCQLHGVKGVFQKESNNLSELMKDSNYHLC